MSVSNQVLHSMLIFYPQKKNNFGFLMRLRIESQWRFHQAIHMLRAPRWPNEEILRLLSSSKWAQHKELSVKSWMCSTGPLPKTSGLSTPFKATLPITFTQTVQTETMEMWKKATLFISVANEYSQGSKVSHKLKDRDYLSIFYFKRCSMFWKSQSQEIRVKKDRRYHFTQGFEIWPVRTTNKHNEEK